MIFISADDSLRRSRGRVVLGLKMVRVMFELCLKIISGLLKPIIHQKNLFS